jgi:hypothetical protein
MSDDEFKILTVQRLPARLSVERVAILLGCQPHDIQGLVRARLLKPLGSPPENGKKMYSAREIVELSQDLSWLNKMTNAIHKRWNVNNSGRKNNSSDRPDETLAA